MPLLVALLVLVVVAGVVIWLLRRVDRASSPSIGRAPRRGPEPRVFAGRVTVRLAVGGSMTDPRVERVVHDAGMRMLAAYPDAEEVTVQDRDGNVLDTVRRAERLRPVAEVPPDLHGPRSHTPHPVRDTSGTDATQPAVRPSAGEPLDLSVPHRPLADRLDLPAGIRNHLTDPDDACELVRSLLVAAGRDATVRGALVLSGEEAVLVVGEPGRSVVPSQMNRAFLQFQESGARSGVVIALGYVDRGSIRRREALAPSLRHADADALQRMADAVALGADPIEWAAGPTLTPGEL